MTGDPEATLHYLPVAENPSEDAHGDGGERRSAQAAQCVTGLATRGSHAIDITPEDLCFLQHTSGSTDEPRA